ncbi:MAG: hypothetical protein KF819_24905 [Labilithrix sp.]|nr:hypothetical protein [Labilithrix sp.]
MKSWFVGLVILSSFAFGCSRADTSGAFTNELKGAPGAPVGRPGSKDDSVRPVVPAVKGVSPQPLPQGKAGGSDDSIKPAPKPALGGIPDDSIKPKPVVGGTPDDTIKPKGLTPSPVPTR